MLNEKCLDEWFSERERKEIIEVENETNGIITQDKIFLLSSEEALKYKSVIVSRDCKIIYAMPKLDEKGAIEIETEYIPCWLRDTCEDSSKVACTYTSGNVDMEEGIDCTGDEVGVRPAAWIQMDSDRIITNDLKRCRGYQEIKILSY